jgi:putative transposase
MLFREVVYQSKIARYLKGRSSRLPQEEYPNLKKRYWRQHLWGRGYFCGTVGTVTEEMIKECIEKHKEEHELTVHDEFQS